MIESEVIKWLVMAGLGGLVWFLKRTIDTNDAEVKTLKLEVQSIKEQYLHKTDFKDFKNELRGMFEELRMDIRSMQK